MTRSAVTVTDFAYKPAEAEGVTLGPLNFEIEEGEFVLLSGASGAGKSTLIRAIASLAPAFDGGTASGEIEVCGLSTRDNGPAEVARVCGTVLQDPERQVVMNTVQAELALPLESRGLTAGEVARGVEEAALMLGIEGLLGRKLQTLSGGELQRVAIAAALAVRPSVLLLDEPASQLDPVAADDLIWTLKRLNEEQGITVLLSEQRMERVLAAVDRVLVLDGGNLVGDNDPRGYLAAAASNGWAVSAGARLHSEAGLPGEPPVSVKELKAALKQGGFTRSAVVAPSYGASDGRQEGSRDNPVEVKGLWDERPSGKTILAGVDFKVADGEVVALMGRNGAGKSTLLRHIAGLEKATRGKVRTHGRVAWLSQTPSAFLMGPTLGDCLSDDLLQSSGLAHLSDCSPKDLSGGETQRAALSLVLSGEEQPKVVLLDEPTRGMDHESAKRLVETVTQLSQKGAAVVVATHDPEIASLLSSKTVLMGDGVVIADGPTRSILTGGWHYSTEVSKALGIPGGPMTATEAAQLLKGAIAEQSGVTS